MCYQLMSSPSWVAIFILKFWGQQTVSLAIINGLFRLLDKYTQTKFATSTRLRIEVASAWSYSSIMIPNIIRTGYLFVWNFWVKPVSSLSLREVMMGILNDKAISSWNLEMSYRFWNTTDSNLFHRMVERQ